MHIDSYEFGSMTVDGQQFTADLILFPETIVPNWWRTEGHSLVIGDLVEIMNYKPEILIVGRGASGVMKIPESTRDYIKGQGIELIAKYTDEATEIFNGMIKSGRKVVGAFHLTC